MCQPTQPVISQRTGRLQKRTSWRRHGGLNFKRREKKNCSSKELKRVMKTPAHKPVSWWRVILTLPRQLCLKEYATRRTQLLGHFCLNKCAPERMQILENG